MPGYVHFSCLLFIFINHVFDAYDYMLLGSYYALILMSITYIKKLHKMNFVSFIKFIS